MNRCVASWSTQIEPYMTFWELPPVDLVVRTKWAIRTSGFLPWEDYAERYFTDLMYPDFTTDQLDSAIQEWHTRKRNYWA
jgi:undecaprenyl diphosphate synthase